MKKVLAFVITLIVMTIGAAGVSAEDLESDRITTLYREGTAVYLDPRPTLLDGIVEVPVGGVAQSMGLEYCDWDEAAQTLTVGIDDIYIKYYMDSTMIDFCGTVYYMNAPAHFKAGVIYVPIEDLAHAFGSGITYEYPDDVHANVFMTAAATVSRIHTIRKQSERANYVNEKGIGSQTNYLIWVSKSDYTVRVYEGQVKNWRLINSFPCAIGASSSPTCTGQFRYYSKETIWRYSNFYVAPIMRFNGGYAIHSTLLRYDGTDYDARTGVGISHGCVRVYPTNMQWLYNTIPLYTRIYITNE